MASMILWHPRESDTRALPQSPPHYTARVQAKSQLETTNEIFRAERFLLAAQVSQIELSPRETHPERVPTAKYTCPTFPDFCRPRETRDARTRKTEPVKLRTRCVSPERIVLDRKSGDSEPALLDGVMTKRGKKKKMS